MLIDEIQGTTISFIVDGRKMSVSLSEVFPINETDMLKEYATQASLYSFFATLSAKAEHEVAIYSLDVDQEYAIQDGDWRETYDHDGVKYTEGMIKQSIISDKEYKRKVERLNTAKFTHKLVKGICDALEQRAQMLISMGAFLRHEADMGNISIREHKYDSSVDNVKKVMKNRKFNADDEEDIPF